MGGWSRTVRNAVAVSVITLMLLVTFAPQPAQAATWHTVSRRTSCVTYSFGRICTRKVYKFRRHSSYCRNWNSDPSDWYAAILRSYSMYQYCYRYSETSYYV